MKILITGSDGVVGKELAIYFKKLKSIKLILHTRKKNQKKKNFYYSKDLSNKIFLSDVPDVIIHCAAINKNFDSSDKKKNKFIKNVKITKNIIDFANNNKVKKIIFFSSMDVYGKITNQLVTEKNIPNKNNYYGRSKLLCENLLNKKNNYFKAICLRIPGILTTDLSKNRPLLINMINKIISRKKIYIYNPNNKFNNVLDVKEVFSIILKILKKQFKINKIYNLSSNYPISIIKIIEKFEKIFLIDANIQISRNKKKSFIISNRKIQRELKISISSTSNIIDRFCKKKKKIEKCLKFI